MQRIDPRSRGEAAGRTEGQSGPRRGAEDLLTPAEAAAAEAHARSEGADRRHRSRARRQAAAGTNLRDVVADYQAKLDAVPTRESDLVELTRDYDTLQTTYQSLLAKREDSKLAANLERRNIGEQFKVLDPARVPERPFSPNRLMIRPAAAVARPRAGPAADRLPGVPRLELQDGGRCRAALSAAGAGAGAAHDVRRRAADRSGGAALIVERGRRLRGARFGGSDRRVERCAPRAA